MKKIYFLLITLVSLTTVHAQIINIPDANFKTKLLQANTTNTIAKNLSGNFFKIDSNNNGNIEDAEAKQVSVLYLQASSITSLEGIQYFININQLNCSTNRLATLDLTTLVNLKSIECSFNNLTYLNVNHLVQLETLNCRWNQIVNLDVSNLANLRIFTCDNNKLTSIILGNHPKISSFDCTRNNLSSLNLSSMSNLRILICQYNYLSTLNVNHMVNLDTLLCGSNYYLAVLDISNLTKLRQLNCDYNSLKSLNVSNLPNLYILFCNNNLISNLDISAIKGLERFSCANNQIANLVVGSSPYNKLFDCSNNKLTSLDLNNYKLVEDLNCSNNLLKSLYLKNGFFEQNINYSGNSNLEYICIDENELDRINNLNLSYNYTKCNVNSYCTFTPGGKFYTIKGNIKFDPNNNGCDVSDFAFPNLKINISDGLTVGEISPDKSGNYSIPVQSGSQTVTPIFENPTYFNASPTRFIVSFPSQASPFSQNFCITANGEHPDLEITLIPLEVARPGFETKYKVIYKNKGNQTQSGSVNLTFDDATLDFISANPVVTTQKLNSLSWDFTNFKPFESREISFTLTVNKPTEIPAVNNGDILKFVATITSQVTDEIPIDNTFTLNQIVVGSYDPNDKTCLEGNVIKPELIGQYVHYMIRFENTGTYQAQNVVVKDMIDLSKFDISSLIPTSSSHSFVTKISDKNRVEFIFENINLPFDDANNDGYIAFKIKTLPTLKVGDSFTNEANIYFDYNFPILTNKATSKFETTLETQDFDFSNYFSLYPNPANEELNIIAKQNIEIQSLTIYDILGQVVIAVPNAKSESKIDVSKLSSGNYFVKVKSDKGISSMKFIKN
ncbi:hypothetical protein FVB9288_01599 [Flavobacterium sp. CECT 9288]|uniref:DUF7619 domain-containing protein n=1 Tax=Flavobacterium sp. CECT 9288 TaxID=2845819 RepID=UPI001E4FF066|nr:T9SS type A sorting domain-containing protein [Flavobacterium sp. CECT 9288]CAH0335934.1 hypothetical protein FVB9288_01599 [Flavobacterium sp. CECT 9288]